jgi:hypothetical protein
MMRGLAVVASWLLLCSIAVGDIALVQVNKQNAQERAGLEMVERPLVR